MNDNLGKVLVVGAGLAGSEAAMYLAKRGVEVVLVENKTLQRNPSQKLNDFAELVCTNSLKSKEPSSGHGVLKYEMNGLGSLVLEDVGETGYFCLYFYNDFDKEDFLY